MPVRMIAPEIGLFWKTTCPIPRSTQSANPRVGWSRKRSCNAVVAMMSSGL